MTYITLRRSLCSAPPARIKNLYLPVIVAVLAASLFCLWVPGANASNVPDASTAPDKQKVEELLSGNSIEGNWDGRPYFQYFSGKGSTVYQETGKSKTLGRWRVNSQGQYCSVWPPFSREVCYQVRVQDRTIYWKSGDNFYPATIIEGDIFNQ